MVNALGIRTVVMCSLILCYNAIEYILLSKSWIVAIHIVFANIGVIVFIYDVIVSQKEECEK